MISQNNKAGRLQRMIGCFVSSGLLLSGCTTVRSERIALANEPFNSRAEGMTYFLPIRLVEVAVTRELLDPKKIKAKIEKLEKELAEAEEEVDNKEEAAKAAKEELDRLKALNASAPTLEEAQVLLDKANSNFVKATKAHDKAKAELQALNEIPIGVGVNGKQMCSFDLKMELLAPQADPSARYVARLVHSPLRDDTLKLTVGTNGLLSSANVVAADRTGDILVELAGAISGLGGGGLSPAPMFAMPSQDPDEPDCMSGPKKFVMIYDPSNGSERSKLETAFANALIPLSINVSDVARDDSVTPSGFAIKNSGKQTGPNSQGFYYRSPIPLTLTVVQCPYTGKVVCKWDAENGQPIDAKAVMLPQAGPVSLIPMRSSTFVKTVNDVQFEDGVITSWNGERPSELLEVVRLPVKLASSIIQVPAQLLSLRVDYSTKAKTLAESQQAQAKALRTSALLQACLRRAGDDDAAVTACLGQ